MSKNKILKKVIHKREIRTMSPYDMSQTLPVTCQLFRSSIIAWNIKQKKEWVDKIYPVMDPLQVSLGALNFPLRFREEVPKTIVCPMEHTQSSDPKGTLSSIGEPKETPMISGCYYCVLDETHAN